MCVRTGLLVQRLDDEHKLRGAEPRHHGLVHRIQVHLVHEADVDAVALKLLDSIDCAVQCVAIRHDHAVRALAHDLILARRERVPGLTAVTSAPGTGLTPPTSALQTGPAAPVGLQLLVLVHSACRIAAFRFCGYRFSMDANSLSDQYIHLTNNAIQKTSDKYDRAHGAGKWSLRSLKLYMASKHGLGAPLPPLLGFAWLSRPVGRSAARRCRRHTWGANLVCSVIRQRW